MSPVRRQLAAAAVALAVLTAGCSNDMSDLMTYVDQVKTRPGGRIEPLPQIKPYETHAYSAEDLRSPFQPDLPQQRSSGGGPQPDDTRNKEYLEQFPLDSLRMVGTVEQNSQTFGLVRTVDGLVHRVLPGNYLGQNDGRIVSISPSEIAVAELVPDGIGGFFQRQAAIGLTD
jgi:type IV pilus assembly protein PilP